METLFFIGLLGVFAYNSSAIGKDFKGSSKSVRTLMRFSGGIGYMIYFIVLIWSFWHYEWWQPIVTAVISTLIGGLSAIFFQKNLVGVLLSPVLTLIFALLSIIGLCNY